jgi:Fe-S cluster assembly iron-binding protein IscA
MRAWWSGAVEDDEGPRQAASIVGASGKSSQVANRSKSAMNLTLAPDAAQRLESDLEGRLLRIAFTTGCGGSGYRLSYADGPLDGDQIVNLNGVRVALDDMSATRLDGAVIRYDAEEDGYLLDHPDAVTAVWCG